MGDTLTRFTANVILGATWIIAWQHILYADELPGDGFTAGTFVLVAILLQFVVRGRSEASRLLPPRLFFLCACAGLGLLAALPLGPWVWGAAPLQHFHIPLGFAKISSTTLFDLAIFLAIGGALLDALARGKEPR